MIEYDGERIACVGAVSIQNPSILILGAIDKLKNRMMEEAKSTLFHKDVQRDKKDQINLLILKTLEKYSEKVMENNLDCK